MRLTHFVVPVLLRMVAAGQPAIVQPGAPGQNSVALKISTMTSAQSLPAAADISFMQGMVMHHAQAVEMTDLLRTRGRSKELQAFGKRIAISQADEIRSMKRWLQDHGLPEQAPMNHNMADMKNMDHSHMGMMPGMLTPEQMAALAKASGPAFDHLFLTGMIQHHNGALVMVDDLFLTPGASQDPVLFDFANDIDNTQRAEIQIMQQMLRKEQQ